MMQQLNDLNVKKAKESFKTSLHAVEVYKVSVTVHAYFIKCFDVRTLEGEENFGFLGHSLNTLKFTQNAMAL